MAWPQENFPFERNSNPLFRQEHSSDIIDFCPSVNTITPNDSENLPHPPFPTPNSAIPHTLGGKVYFIPLFSGDDDVSIETFFEKLNFIRNLSAWTEHQTLCIARLRLAGSAAEYVSANPHVVKNFRDFLWYLKQRFSARISPLSLECLFSSCTQQPLETANYATRLRKIARQLLETLADPSSEVATAMIENRLLLQFLSGLREEIGRFVQVRQPKSMLVAEEYALQEEANVKSYATKKTDARYVHMLDSSPYDPAFHIPPPQAGRITRIPSLSLSSSSFPQVNHISERQGLRPHPTPIPSPVHKPVIQDRPPNANRSCYSCGKTGHISKYCRSQPQRCYNCGEKSHFSKECPIQCRGICKEVGHRPLDCPIKKTSEKPENGIVNGKENDRKMGNWAKKF
ncbi:uncharacterized protein LOC124171064 [Ischnura elegans]|uniref:uncharacterized protein LOC124171064 n=1 Tax=Ischnura elegans TaxID=197161 RepID=UPI001ED8B865|nr:uncharacterized protein LOC124171064 [Ischnura elegans]